MPRNAHVRAICPRAPVETRIAVGIAALLALTVAPPLAWWAASGFSPGSTPARWLEAWIAQFTVVLREIAALVAAGFLLIAASCFIVWLGGRVVAVWRHVHGD